MILFSFILAYIENVYIDIGKLTVTVLFNSLSNSSHYYTLISINGKRKLNIELPVIELDRVKLNNKFRIFLMFDYSLYDTILHVKEASGTT